MTPRGIDPTRRRRAMPSVRQPPADFRKLSSQFQIGRGILRHRSKLERPSVHRRDSQPQAKRESALRKAELAQLRAEFVACHTPGYRAQNGRVKPTLLSTGVNIFLTRIFLLRPSCSLEQSSTESAMLTMTAIISPSVK